MAPFLSPRFFYLLIRFIVHDLSYSFFFKIYYFCFAQIFPAKLSKIPNNHVYLLAESRINSRGNSSRRFHSFVCISMIDEIKIPINYFDERMESASYKKQRVEIITELDLFVSEIFRTDCN